MADVKIPDVLQRSISSELSKTQAHEMQETLPQAGDVSIPAITQFSHSPLELVPLPSTPNILLPRGVFLELQQRNEHE